VMAAYGVGNHITTMICGAVGISIGTAVCVGGIFRDILFEASTSFFLTLLAGFALGATHAFYYKLAKHMQHAGAGIINCICSSYIAFGTLFGLLPPLSENPTANKVKEEKNRKRKGQKKKR
jgi:hypothetical protein